MSSPTRGAREAVSHVAAALLAVVLAPVCASCNRVLDRPIEGPICQACWAGVVRLIPPLCRTCGGMLPSWRVVDRATAHCAACRRGALPALDVSAAAGAYEGTLKNIIHAFKYEGRRSLAGPLGALMRDAGRRVLDGAACVVPVPLHPWRQIRRGFNQSSDLAATMHLPVVHALWRRRTTAPQTGLTAAARRRNVNGAFRRSPFVSRDSLRSMLIDRVVVLVDDVRTTGATLDACARVLKGAGVREVRALTVARADPPMRRTRHNEGHP
jgi:ComF family protein